MLPCSPPGLKERETGNETRAQPTFQDSCDTPFHPRRRKSPPPKKYVRDWYTYDSNVSGTVTVLELIPLPPLNSVQGEITLVVKTSSRSKWRIRTPLTAAALTPRLVKHGKKVHINHFYVSLAHTRTSVLKATAKLHGIGLTGESVHVQLVLGQKGIGRPLHITR